MAGTITYIAPVEYGQGKIFGKKNKWTAVKRSYGNKQKGCAYGGERNMVTHPETDNERQQKAKFTTVAKTVAEKKQLTSPTYAQDIAAYAALSQAEKAKYPTFRSFLWHREWNK